MPTDTYLHIYNKGSQNKNDIFALSEGNITVTNVSYQEYQASRQKNFMTSAVSTVRCNLRQCQPDGCLLYARVHVFVNTAMHDWLSLHK